MDLLSQDNQDLLNLDTLITIIQDQLNQLPRAQHNQLIMALLPKALLVMEDQLPMEHLLLMEHLLQLDQLSQ